jgi:hypothetical protein
MCEVFPSIDPILLVQPLKPLALVVVHPANTYIACVSGKEGVCCVKKEETSWAFCAALLFCRRREYPI